MNFNKLIKNKLFQSAFFILLLTGVFFFTMSKLDTATRPQVISYNQFENMATQGKIQKAKINLKNDSFIFIDAKGNSYITDNPKTQTFKEYLLKSNINVVEEHDNQVWVTLLVNLVPLLFWVLIIVYFMKGFTKGISPVKTSKGTKPTTSNVKFADIAGNEESKEDIINLVNFVKQPKKYIEMGAKLPKGVIFYGPPGTGKTLMAKAIAGEANVPFYYMSGSDFVEMYVGVGAKRVRELFTEAKKNAPCVIFIDEIDAIGGQRGNSSSGGDSEKNQTINALLSEMDGFNGSEGIIVIAATNRENMLDDALTRPGRFDRKIAIGLPELKDRLNILQLHAKNKKFADDVNLEELAKLTTGFAGAGLQTILNEAAIIAVNNNHEFITKEDVDTAYFNMVMSGSKKKKDANRKVEEIKLVAWHEAGHAVVAKLKNKSVPKVTIIPSTSGAGGATFITPDKMGLYSKQELIDDVMVSYGGNVAEYLLLGERDMVTTGASSDIKHATNTIKGMIKYYGMTDTYGMLNLDQFENVDKGDIIKEASEMSKQFYKETELLLTEKKEVLQKVAEALIEKETISESELDFIIFNKTEQEAI